MKTSSRITTLCKRDISEIENMVKAFIYYDSLQGKSITMRSFSINCYRDSKYFEKHVMDLFLSIGKKYNNELINADEEKELGACIFVTNTV